MIAFRCALAATLLLALPVPALAGQPLGLFTSLPILWPEATDPGALLRSNEVHWARRVLDRRGPIVALDRLALDDPKGLGGIRLLVMPQPRALAPAESVAIDRWVRGGGRLLLFADPMLTGRSSFALGDRRRPQAIVRVEPLLRHWGLRLDFVSGQPAGERNVKILGADLPVNLPGRLMASGRACRLVSGGLAASCRIGAGRVLVVADAALFEQGREGDPHRRESTLETLLERLESR